MPAHCRELAVAQAFPIVRRALKILADREVSPQTGLLKSTLLQLDSTFSERNYGASSFLDFVEKLAHAGFVQLKHAGPQRHGGAEPSFDEGDRSRRHRLMASRATPPSARSAVDSAGAAPRVDHPRDGFSPASGQPGEHPRPLEPVGPPAGDQADGVRLSAACSRPRERRDGRCTAQREADSPG